MKVYAAVKQHEYEGFTIISTHLSEKNARKVCLEAQDGNYLKYSHIEVPYNEDGLYVMELEVLD